VEERGGLRVGEKGRAKKVEGLRVVERGGQIKGKG
jgi:hypothetical protein